MTVYLVRHAAAGDRERWADDDWLRPLTNKGRAQARGLLEVLADAQFTRIVSSPYVRCTETVLPIAGARRLPIELDDALAEDAELEAALGLLKQVADRGGVLCSHGDIIPAMLGHLEATGVAITGARCEKGSVWALDTRDGSVVAARYLSPLAR